MSVSDTMSLGTVVDVPTGRGLVRFNGTTEFAPGRWIGIELYEPKGKNDGSVQGIQYFKCNLPHGVFVRPSQVKVVSLGGRVASPLTTPTPIVAVRPPVGHTRALSSGRIRTQSLRSVAPPSPAISRVNSPQKPATPASAGPPSPTKKTTLGPPASITPRPALARSKRTDTADSVPPSPVVVIRPQRLAEPATFLLASSKLPPQPERPPSSLVREIQAEADQETQELRAKIRVLEAKRSDDARVIEKLEAQLADVNHFVALRPKLQQKLAALQQEITSNRRALADSEQLQATNENRMLDAQEQLEMAMLDKEVAEERAEAAEMELQSLQEKFESLEVELESLNEGGATAGGEVEDSIKSSIAYNQLEKHNDRLKEALIRLRDVSRETEQEQRHRIAELERELQGVEELHSQYDSSLGKLSNAEIQIDELKAQLDDALGAEEMLEQLTERNLVLGEKIAEMTITIEDLEALKELNDELEENHVETEKQLQEEIEQKDSQSREQAHKISDLEDACQDFEGTINQFRELVLQLQAELDILRTQNQNAQDESATVASQTAAMMSVNLKLQSSASKNQARLIELELRKIELKETKELLGIVQPYLPQLYIETDSVATHCYLYFQRMAAKADLINSVVGTIHGLPESLNGRVSDVLVRTCEMRGLISIVSTLCKRFASVLKRCDVESFLTIGRVYPEIAPLEKRFDTHIDLLRREEFRDMECYADMSKAHQQYEHLAETYFNAFDHDLGDREFGYVQSFDNDLDLFSASLALVHTSLSEIMNDGDVTIELDDDPAVKLFEPLQRLLDQSKGAKNLSKKLTKRLEELTQESAALGPHLLPQLKALTNVEMVNFGVQLGQTVVPYLADIRNNKGTLQTKAVLDFVKQIAAASLGKGEKNEVSWDVVSEAVSNLIQEAGAVIPMALDPENILKISGTAPWVTRVEEIKATLAVNVEAERKVTQLNEEIQGLARGIRSRDQTIQESSVRIELMERRLDTVKKQADAISSLETEITKARKQERSYEEAIEQLQSDLDVLEQDNAKLKQLTAGLERQPSVGPQSAETENVTAVESNLETSHLLEQIEALRGAVRYLRRENSYLKGQDLLKEIQALPPIPDLPSRPSTPPLDPSGSSSESDSDPEEPRTPSLRSLATETNALYRDVITFSSSPRVVDLSIINKKRTDTAQHVRGWMPKKLTPSHQLLERKHEAEQLSRRVKGLLEKASVFGAAR
ncbi:dynactin [Phellopilus nigrolimitatus]|nr:dynactin [Phellopilus nigrolimitatus]